MKIGDEVYVHGYVDEIRNGTIIIRNEGGYFGAAPDEVMPSAQPDTNSYQQGVIQGRVEMRTEMLTKLKELVGGEVWANI